MGEPRYHLSAIADFQSTWRASSRRLWSLRSIGEVAPLKTFSIASTTTATAQDEENCKLEIL